jgi:nicotinate-nucleotide pyrophosphorylase
VDYISIGALTHSVKVFDVSMKNIKLVNLKTGKQE